MLERFAARVLEARIASSTSHRIVLEVLLDADIVLPPDEQVDVLGDSGEWVRAAIANGSTRGRCRAGDTIRFVLTLPAHTPGFPEPITFVGLGDSLVLKPIR
jgi:hypothetical protein